jgi:ribosomal protein S18 acetylase RimI-like enzyme
MLCDENGLKIRDFHDNDYPQLVELWKSTGLWKDERSDDLEVIKRTLKHGGKLLVLVCDEKIIGSSWLTTDGRRLSIQYFAIAPQYQGKHFSHVLMKEAIKFAAKKGMQVKLEVHKTNIKAKKLYEKWGFKPLEGYRIYILRDPESQV